MAYSDFDKLKTFLTELKNVHYRLDLVRSRVQAGGRWATIDKKECLNLLREKIPELQDKDDAFLTKYLSDPRNIKGRLLAEFTTAERVELEQSLAEEVPQVQPPAGAAAEGEAAAEQIPPAAGKNTAEGGVPGMSIPTAPVISPMPRSVRYIPPAPESGMAGGTGAGTAATAKGNRLTANAPSATEPSRLPSSPAKINWPAFRSKVGGRVAGAMRSGLERANPFLGRMGHGLASGLTGIANPRGIGGVGSRSFFGRFSRFGRGGGRAVSSFGKSVKDRKWLLYLIGILSMMFLTGFIATTAPQPTPTPGATPTPTTSDISQCKFTRGAETPPEASFKSSTLLGYIQEASQKSSIPPVVLAAFIRVESPPTSNMTNEQIANYATNCAVSPTGALGIMQIQPPGTTSLSGDPASCDDCIDAGARLIGKTVNTMVVPDDYCDPRTSIIVGAGWILKKMSKLNYGDGTRWDPAWTNDKTAIEKLVNTYYGCTNYGSADDTRTSCDDPTRIYSYVTDVLTSIKSCQTPSASCTTSGNCPLVSCPLSRDGSGSFDITCGTFNNPSSGGCGHGAPEPAYPPCLAPPYAICPYSDQLKASIDVRPSGSNGNNTPIYLPFINGQSVNWTLASGPTTLNQGTWGVKVEYTAAMTDGKQIRLDLTHLDQNIIQGANKSGEQVGITKAGIDDNGLSGHLHTAASVNGGWIDSISEAKMCTL